MEEKKNYKIKISCSEVFQDGILDWGDSVKLTEKEFEDYKNCVPGNRGQKIADEYLADNLSTGCIIEEVEDNLYLPLSNYD